MNILMCSVGRRGELLKDFKNSMSENSKIIATDMSVIAPAIYMADKFYIVPKITDDIYIPTILEICKKEEIQMVTTLIDPEIMLLAEHRSEFEAIGVEVLAPYKETAEICFDKFEMFRYLQNQKIKTVLTYGDIGSFKKGLTENKIEFPVFVKPRRGSGSVGARKISDMNNLEKAFNADPTLIIQEFMGDALDIDADIYVDTISKKVVSLFSKRKLETKIGGASKTISFKDEKLNDFVVEALKHFQFNGPMDMDLWYRNGEYYLSEINPRFGGGYLHAYGAGVDFVKLINNNVNGIENQPCFGNYDDNVVMMMYDSVVIQKIDSI
ncbi:MAG: ATP-grasp domain-containing protein [Roseburia sp.]|uniref:ATP-grasp domain-containing protein n=1 Tax=Roseburia sp. 831b TaxID=1261635 RepID=UPI000953522A|nr:ATP-grasp domain-containing protein [Roseburia sp. 831b]MCI5920243.1 ATP-grasp domain-containing protein [Roseburia sp.]WVK71999.1 ATP-grasp domain-containing protein [Roseburia sp. 831b]